MGGGRKRTGPHGAAIPGGGARRYSKELVARAIEKVEKGESLADVAREFKTSPSSVQYWVDHAERYLSASQMKALTFETGLDDYTRQKLHREGWGVVFTLLNQVKKQMKDWSPEQKLKLMVDLMDRLAKLARPMVDQRPSPNNGRPGSAAARGRREREDEMDAIREIQLLVAKMTTGNKRTKEGKKEGKIRARPPADAGSPSGDAARAIDTTAELADGSGTNETTES